MKFFWWPILIMLALSTFAAERAFDFSTYPADQPPADFRSLVFGAGKPGDWKIIQDEAPAPGSARTNATALSQRAVLAQTTREPLSSHVPILIYDREMFGDFKLTTRFKLAGGALEQAAGIVFRFQNESNFYMVQASALEKKFQCFKVENGIVKPPIGPAVEIRKGTWHELLVECEGTRIHCSLDGNEGIKLIDNSIRKTGQLGFCTRADAVSYFIDTRINYTPHEPLAQLLIHEALREYPRLLDLKIFAVRKPGESPAVIGSKDEKEIGHAGGKTEQTVISEGNSYFGRSKGSVTVVLPLRDRNGEAIAAVQIVMKSFTGQTEDNALVRAQPIIKLMQPRVPSLENLLE